MLSSRLGHRPLRYLDVNNPDRRRRYAARHGHRNKSLNPIGGLAEIDLQPPEQHDRQHGLNDNGHSQSACALARPVQFVVFDVGGHGARSTAYL
jgi:hypothetical protein